MHKKTFSSTTTTRYVMQAKQFLFNQRVIRIWLGDVLGMSFSSNDVFPMLRDGNILCRLANHLVPGSVTISDADMTRKKPAIAIDNIAQFIGFCKREMGLDDSQVFETVDLFEKKNMTKVVSCILNVSRRLSGNERFDHLNIPNISETIAKCRMEGSGFSEGQLNVAVAHLQTIDGIETNTGLTPEELAEYWGDDQEIFQKTQKDEEPLTPPFFDASGILDDSQFSEDAKPPKPPVTPSKTPLDHHRSLSVPPATVTSPFSINSGKTKFHLEDLKKAQSRLKDMEKQIEEVKRAAEDERNRFELEKSKLILKISTLEESYSNNEDVVASLESSRAELESEKEILKANLNAVRSQLKQQGKTIQQLTADLQIATREAESAQEKQDAAFGSHEEDQQEIMRLNDRIRMMVEDHEKMIKEHQEVVGLLNADLDEERDKRSRNEERIASLEDLVNDYRKEVAQYREDGGPAQAEWQKLEEKKKRLGNEEDNAKLIILLQTQLSDLRFVKGLTQSETCSTVTSERDMVMDKLREEREKLQDYSRRFASLSERYGKQVEKGETERNKRKEEQTKKDEHDSIERKALEGKLMEAARQIEILRGRLSKNTRQYDTTLTASSNLQQVVEDLKKENEELVKSLMDSRKRIAELEKKNSSIAQKEVESRQAETSSSIRASLDDAAFKINDLTKRLLKSKRDHEATKRELCLVEANFNRNVTNDIMAQAQAEATDRINQARFEYEAQVAKAKTRFEEREERLNKKIDSLQTEIGARRSQVLELKEEMRYLKMTNKATKTHLQRVEKERSKKHVNEVKELERRIRIRDKAGVYASPLSPISPLFSPREGPSDPLVPKLKLGALRVNVETGVSSHSKPRDSRKDRDPLSPRFAAPLILRSSIPLPRAASPEPLKSSVKHISPKIKNEAAVV